MVPARSVSDLVHESPLRAPSSWKHGQNTDKTIKGFGTLIPKPLICWLRGLDLNQRPLGYEPTRGPDCNRLLPMKAPETRASPSLPLGSDRRLLEGVPAQFPHNRGSLVSSRRATIREAGLKLSAHLDFISVGNIKGHSRKFAPCPRRRRRATPHRRSSDHRASFRLPGRQWKLDAEFGSPLPL